MSNKHMARVRVGSKPAGVAGGATSAEVIFGVGSTPVGRRSIRKPLSAGAYLDHGPGSNTSLWLGFIGPSARGLY